MTLLYLITTTTLLSVATLCRSSSPTPTLKRLSPVLDIARLEAPGPGSCQDDLLALRRGLDSRQTWALSMWDANVKVPVGLLSLTGVQFGDFDECLSVTLPVVPQYCLADVRLNSTLMFNFRWGLCVPASCSVQELQTSLQRYLDFEAAGVNVQLEETACTTRDSTASEFTFGDAMFSLVLITIFGIVTVATTYDIVVRPEHDGISPPRTVSQCLSMRHAWQTLLCAYEPVSGVNLSAINGLRTVAFFFLILCHRYIGHLQYMTLTNYRDFKSVFVDSWITLWASHGDLFVDMFFCMSAFIMSYFYMVDLEKQFVHPLKNYLFRICRLIPVYALTVFFYATVYRHLGTGPLWNMYIEREMKVCRAQWWTNLLFINNYVGTNQMCILQSWFLACDFQLYMVGVVLVLVLYRWFWFGVLTSALLFGASTLAAFLGTYLYDRPGMLVFNKEFCMDFRHHDLFTSVYTQAHFRGTSYLPGLLTGVYVYKNRNNYISKNSTRILQIIGLAIILPVWWSSSLFYNEEEPPNLFWSSIYAATFHTAFGLGFSMLIVSFALGSSSPLNNFFSWWGFMPLNQLSYIAYLVHIIVQSKSISSLRGPAYIDLVQLVSMAIGDIVITLLVSLVLYLIVEAPFRHLTRFFRSGPRSLQPKESKKIN